jgi:succinate dehydrogenase / fumarate reductase membrane anchor subunit
MLNLTTALGRNGFQDWIVQRVSAVILALYTFLIFGFWLFHPIDDHAAWQALYFCTWMRYCTLLSMLALIVHAWIGVWTVVTDYLHIAWLRLLVFAMVFAILLYEFVWCVQILWGLN